MSKSLFSSNDPSLTPLAERMRPSSIDDYVGQDHLLGPGKIIRLMIDKQSPFSMMLWGDPGCGKTTIASLIAQALDMESHFLSAVSSGVSDVRKVIEKGRNNRLSGVKTLLFIDEIHRFNKAQQDAVLGAVEAGEIILIGATTENPSFSVIAPLLSRSRVLRLYPLRDEDLERIAQNALSGDSFLSQKNISFAPGVLDKAVQLAVGDARRLLNIIEVASMISENGIISDEILKEALKESFAGYDRTGDKHYDTISAFIKSMRGSDPDASVYYLAKMIDGGEDPLFIARRMVIFASEDVGNASPHALPIAVSCMTALQNIGLPEAQIVMSQCATFLASSPKSNAACSAIGKAMSVVKEGGVHEIPMHIRNASTGMMENMGYGKGYKYPHNYTGHFVHEQYLPETLKNVVFYDPADQGSETAIRQRLRTLWPKRYEKE